MKNKKNQELGGVIKNDKKNYPSTGEWSQTAPEISDKCIACGQCSQFCPEGVIEIEKINNKDRAVVDYDYCKGCGLCSEICPVKAILMKDKKESER